MSADVRSLEVLQEWYAALAEFGSEASEALSAVNQQVLRAMPYLEEQVQLWAGRTRMAEEELVRAQAELRNRQFPDFSGRIPDCSVQRKAVRRAEEKLEFCRRQVGVVRHWMAVLPRMIGEAYEGPSRRLGSFLEGELPRALADLDRRLAALERYTETTPDSMPEGLREQRSTKPNEGT